LLTDYFFLDLRNIQPTINTNPKMRIKAHHIPALNIPCTTEQPEKEIMIIKSNR